MKVTSERIVVGGFGLALLLLCAVGGAAYFNVQMLVENRRWVDHTHRVLKTLNELSSSLNNVETGRRGYVLTEETNYLETYNTEIQSTKEAIETVRQLIRDNLKQKRTLEQLEPIVAQKLALSEQSIDLIQQKQSTTAAQRTLSQQGIISQQLIQAKLAEMDAQERTLLQQRTAATDKSVQTIFVLIVVGYCLSFSLLLGVYFLLQRQIRDRKKAEAALIEANKQLESKIQEHTEVNAILQKEIVRRLAVQQKLEQLARSLKHSNQELEQFAYVASHDLQEPLRAVTSYTQMLSRKYQNNLDEKADKYINYIVDGATRMQQLINDLLTYSRVGRQKLELTTTDCNAVLEQIFRNLQVTIMESNGVITYDSLPTVMADTAQLTQLFQNLIANALKYHGEDPPKVHISATRQEAEWVFSVQDNGIGIDPQYAERIFIIFQRLHTRRSYPGTGIGLAICKKIVELHKGRIWVESQPGAGTTFLFTIPIDATDKDN